MSRGISRPEAERVAGVLGASQVPAREGDPVLQFLGVVDSLTSPFGFNGGFWYLRLSGQFNWENRGQEPGSWFLFLFLFLSLSYQPH